MTITFTDIGNQAFTNCQNLKTVTFDVDMDTIPANMFQNCASLTTINGIEGVKSLGNNAFSGCKSLTYFRVPDASPFFPPGCSPAPD